MYTIHEGEVIFKEKYGSAPKQRLYVKPPDQLNLVVLEENKLDEITSVFKRVFLPHGYPESVSGDYIAYQIWDTAQAFCSTITGILATQEVLRGVGVGDTSATPLAATITWVLKDGCGHIGKIIFAYSHGIFLDAHSKKWRLYADTLNDAAMCIELALPMFHNYTTIVLCVSTMMKAIVGVAGGATRAAMTQHHAIRGNLADVAAKDSAQETAVNLIASITALVIITLFGNCLTIFLIMMMFHIIFNYLAVRAVCLRTLNAPRFLQVIESYLGEELVSNPCCVNKNEPIVLFHLVNVLDRKLCGFNIKMGHSMKKVVKRNPKANYIKNLSEVYKGKEFAMLASIQSRKIYVVLRDSATTDDMLRAYFQGVLFGIAICAINNYPLVIYKKAQYVDRPFSQICRTLNRAEWSKDHLLNPIGRFKFEPSLELMTFMNDIVDQEWPIMREGLKKTGWDLSKHLLVVDEWRICTSSLVAKIISVDTTTQGRLSSSKLITFNEIRDRVSSDGSEEKAYTIEPDKAGSPEGLDYSTPPESDENTSNARMEPTLMTVIAQHKSTEEKSHRNLDQKKK